MIAMTLRELAAVVGGVVVDGALDTLVTAPAFLDSREVEVGGLFVAVAGEHVDGHDFAAAAVAAGATAALVARRVGAPAVLVEDVQTSLGALAGHLVRALPDLHVVGITASQGKTTTKDLLAQVLERAGETVAPPGSFNNEWGLPLTVLQATPSTRYLVLELGARGRGHIAYLTSIAPVSVGIVLNVGQAHVGEFGSVTETAAAKGELVEALPPTGVAVLNADDDLVAPMRSRTTARVLTFGADAGADVAITAVRLDELGRIEVCVVIGGTSYDLRLGLVGSHHAHNAAAAIAGGLALGLDPAAVVETLQGAGPRSRWRMEVSESPTGVVVVNDAYNANPESVQAALATLAEIGHRRTGAGRTFAVLGEMRELGERAIAEHEAVGREAVRLDIDRLVVVGQAARAIHRGAHQDASWAGESVCVDDADAAVALLRGAVRPGDVVLVKASRVVGLERVAAALLSETEAHR